MQLPEEIKELFSFSRTERNGLLILFLIIVLVVGARVYINYSLSSENQMPDTARFASEIAEFRKALEKKDDPEYISRLDKYIIERYDSIQLFRFNPNTVSKEQWKELGLSEKQIQTIMNFRAKGGKFYDKNDFRRMYGIRTRQYLILEPYIDLPEHYYPSSYRQYSSSYKSSGYGDDAFEPDSLFMFDPNKATSEQLEALGLSYKQASAVINYRKSGGNFRKKSDFKKIYTISEKEYSALEPYIDLPNEKPLGNMESESELVDINALSEQEFRQLDDKFWQYNARNIVKYRNLLGGYVHPDQLLEVYGVKKFYYEKVKDQIALIETAPAQLRINFASEEELARHPYIRDYDAEAIVQFRDKNGPFKRVSDIRKHKLVSETSYQKIQAYLTVN